MKRILSLLLTLIMLTALCLPVLADGSKDHYPYKYYMCVGDSIAAGCALTKDGSETYFDNETDDYTTVYDPEYIYFGYDYSVVPQAYHSLVANELDSKLLQCARSGMRAVEFRYFLEGVYNDYDESCQWGNTYFDVDGNGFSIDDLDAINAAVNYPEMIKKTDLLSVNVGSNDVFSFTLGVVVQEMTAGSENDQLKEIKEFLDKGGSIGAAFGKLVDFCQTTGAMSKLMAVMTATFYKAYDQFVVNFDAVMEKIYELNPDITVVGVGVFNPFKHFRLSADNQLDISAAAAPLVTAINSHIKSFENKYDNFYYADVVGTETYDMNYDDRYFWEYFILKVHPTIAGHEYMAQQILDALPGREPLPFTDVPEDAWYYEELYYVYAHGIMKGTTQTTFSPDATSTRAQVVTVLYRLAGSPDVSGLAEPFKDVPDDYWCRDAIIWGYNEGVIKGFTPTRFAPAEEVTRAQLVTMLYRYAGSPGAEGDLSMFTDAADIAGPYRAAAVWAVENGVVQGYKDGSFRPDLPISRAQLAVILARYDRQ
ncbi:MAG: S-layer homology domain-containing protein [Oscillospiraceae bacterium]